MSDSVTEQLAARFCARTLLKTEWTHEAHLRVGLWHVLKYGPEEALGLLRPRIRAHNESVGTANTDSSGYHETITRFYVWRIGLFLRLADASRTADELASELVRELGDRDLPLAYWSRELLMSREARLGWVEPDVRGLNEISGREADPHPARPSL